MTLTYQNMQQLRVFKNSRLRIFTQRLICLKVDKHKSKGEERKNEIPLFGLLKNEGKGENISEAKK